MMSRTHIAQHRPRGIAASGEVLNAVLLEAALARGARGTLAILDLAEELGIAPYVPADPAAKRSAAAMLQRLLGRPPLRSTGDLHG